MLHTFLDNTLRINYMKYELISSNRYRVLVTVDLKKRYFGKFRLKAQKGCIIAIVYFLNNNLKCY